MVEHNLAKVRVASSSLVSRSDESRSDASLSGFFLSYNRKPNALVVESVDTQDLKSCDHCGRAGSSPARGTKIRVRNSSESLVLISDFFSFRGLFSFSFCFSPPQDLSVSNHHCWVRTFQTFAYRFSLFWRLPGGSALLHHRSPGFPLYLLVHSALLHSPKGCRSHPWRGPIRREVFQIRMGWFFHCDISPPTA